MPPIVKKILALAALLILLNIGFVKFGQASFNADFQQLAKAFSENNATLPRRTELPEPIRRYIERTGVAKKPYKTLAMEIEGEYYKKPGAKPVAMHALALLRPTPDMLWAYRMESSVVTFNALETYHGGRSKMKMSLFGIIPTGEFSSDLFARSELAHALAYALFNPELFECACIDYETPAPNKVRATIHDGNLSASMLFTFDEAGDAILAESSDRARSVDGKLVRTDWAFRVEGYGNYGPYRLPAKVHEIWIVNGRPVTAMAYRLKGAEAL